jgi:hypothetical protein
LDGYVRETNGSAGWLAPNGTDFCLHPGQLRYVTGLVRSALEQQPI